MFVRIMAFRTARVFTKAREFYTITIYTNTAVLSIGMVLRNRTQITHAKRRKHYIQVQQRVTKLSLLWYYTFKF
jgi:hypothetical protein